MRKILTAVSVTNTMMQSLQDLVRATPYVTVRTEDPAYPILDIANDYATASIALHGAQVFHFQPKHQQPVLWCSQSAHFTAGKPIRGGVPICWPWFGKHSDSNFPAHGFARNHFWQCDSVMQLDNGETELCLSLSSAKITQTVWPKAYELALVIQIGEQLNIALTMKNKSNVDCVYTAALHSYLAVGDINTVTLNGLEDVAYADKVNDVTCVAQREPVSVLEPMDRVYQNTVASVSVNDPAWNRKLLIEKSGSLTTVVWNPWAEAAKKLSDFDNNGYVNMICVEAANAFDDVVSLAPGEQYTLATTLSVLD